MNRFNFALAVAAVVIGFTAAAPKAEAGISINIGAAPVCPYGYYDYAPYACAPYGYYSPEWFNGGIFVGAGPWFHGPADFHGHVDNRFDLHRGYRGPLPHPGDRPDPARRLDHIDHFRGSEMRDGRGHVGGGRR
jgi:hypothetical protein